MNGTQEALLTAIGEYQGVATPQNLARHLPAGSSTQWSWQGVARVAGQLARKGLVRRIRLPKMTYYELTPAGREELENDQDGT